MSKRFLSVALGLLLLWLTPSSGLAGSDISEFPSCQYCGMFRDKFAHSRMLIEYEGGGKVPLCSLHCAAIDLANNIDRAPTAIGVGDFGTKELIGVENAFWVLGGEGAGVMTARPKWAFAKREDAEKYILRHGGALVSFEEAMAAAYQDMSRDTRMIRDKRQAKRLKMEGGK